MIPEQASGDHDALQLAVDLMAWASEILNGLLEQHRKDYPLQMLAFLNGAKRDADLGKQEAEMGDRYMGWRGPVEDECHTYDGVTCATHANKYADHEEKTA